MRGDDRVVADVVIGVAGDKIGIGDAAPNDFGDDRDVKGSPCASAAGAQDVVDFIGCGLPRIAEVWGFRELDQHAARAREPCEAVDMVIGDVFAFDARGPDPFECAMGGQQAFFDFGFGEAVAVVVYP